MTNTQNGSRAVAGAVAATASAASKTALESIAMSMVSHANTYTLIEKFVTLRQQ